MVGASRLEVVLPPLLLGGALLAALPYHGQNASGLAGVQIPLLACALVVALGATRRALILPRHPTPWLLGLLWLWLALTPAWSPVPFVSRLAFWSLGTLPLMCWLWLAGGGGEAVWRWLAGGLLATGVGLGLLGLYQHFVLGEPARGLFVHRHSYTAFLNVVVLVAAARCLAAAPTGARAGLGLVLYGGCVALVLFCIGVAAGRGALLGLLAGTALLASLAAPRVGRLRLTAFVAVAVGVLTLAALSAPETQERNARRMRADLAQVVASDPGAARGLDEAGHALQGPSAGVSPSQRLLLWRSTLELLADTPWYGLGAGTFWLAFPPYRHHLEATSGQHAHNDYLELLVELGWPGLILVVAAAVTLVGGAARLVRDPRRGPREQIEAAGLLAGLVAVGVHSLVSFNLYVVPILVLCGLCTGRLIELGATPPAGRGRSSEPAARLAPALVLAVRRPVATLVAALLLWPLTTQASRLYAERLESRAEDAVAQGRYADTAASLERAFRLHPTDRPLGRLAGMYVALLASSSGLDASERQAIYREAARLVEQAERLNPLRPQTQVLRARLYRAAPDLAGASWGEAAAAAYRRALVLDPRHLGARLDYVTLLLERGRTNAAAGAVEAGLALPLDHSPSGLPFYAFAVDSRARRGDLAGARAVLAHVRATIARNALGDGAMDALDLRARAAQLDG